MPSADALITPRSPGWLPPYLCSGLPLSLLGIPLALQREVATGLVFPQPAECSWL